MRTFVVLVAPAGSAPPMRVEIKGQEMEYISEPASRDRYVIKDGDRVVAYFSGDRVRGIWDKEQTVEGDTQ